MSFFEQSLLPEVMKRDLCINLLHELGITQFNENKKGELIHSCPLPYGQHKNGDRNASASLNYKKLTFNCFGCHNSGGILWFTAVCRGEEMPQVRKWLEETTGTGSNNLDSAKLLELIDAIFAQKTYLQQPLPNYHPSILDNWKQDFFFPSLTEGDSELGIKGRHIPEPTLKKFQIGFNMENDRITIPLFWKGKLVGWQGRRAWEHMDKKYKNSGDFPRDRVLYNYHDENRAILVESPMSVLRHYHHQPSLIASFGSELADDQLRLLHRYDRVTLWFDNDKAGWRSTRLVGNALMAYTSVFAVINPYGDADPADLPDHIVDELLVSAVPYAVWQLPATRQSIPQEV